MGAADRSSWSGVSSVLIEGRHFQTVSSKVQILTTLRLEKSRQGRGSASDVREMTNGFWGAQ